jgi:hypothetical protein
MASQEMQWACQKNHIFFEKRVGVSEKSITFAHRNSNNAQVAE